MSKIFKRRTIRTAEYLRPADVSCAKIYFEKDDDTMKTIKKITLLMETKARAGCISNGG